MSAFGFISSSPPLSSLLIEDLYDSQQWVSSASASTTKSDKPTIQASYFSILDDLAEQSGGSTETSPTKQSTFMSPNSVVSTSSSSNITRPKTIKATNEMKLISATSLLYRLGTEKTNAMHVLHRLYAKQWQTTEQMTQLNSKLQLISQQKDIALTQEDYLVAESLQTQEQKLNDSLEELRSLSWRSQVYDGWLNVSKLMEQESKAAVDVLQWSGLVKEERQLQHMKFINDLERMHQVKLQDLNRGREQVESEKSQVAFDLGIWEQDQQDLEERKEEAVQKDKVQKNEISTEIDLVQHEIDELRLKLNVLQSKKEALVASKAEIEQVMHEKLEPFFPETQEQEQEFQSINQRQDEIKSKAQELDEQERLIDQEIQKHAKEKEHGVNELSRLDEQINFAEKTSLQDATLIQTTLKQIQLRDQTVLQHESELQKSRQDLMRQKIQVESIQNQVYHQQQVYIQVQEEKVELTQKLSRLQRLKQVAVDTKKFQQASTISNQIKSVQSQLDTLACQEQPTTEQDQELAISQKELTELELLHDALQKEKSTEIKLILEQFKDAQKDNVIPLLEHELKLVQLQLSD
ncbi:hypothetical protein HPULCUR_007692 [Helicostylum pulchrum]|uniref:Uncharacterized protein n=1 Tax=Helicostylum pulchrum TaxID=562976 RepID=A0ABP9Y5H2_9FUNG